jgi:hypothetical protein
VPERSIPVTAPDQPTYNAVSLSQSYHLPQTETSTLADRVVLVALVSVHRPHALAESITLASVPVLRTYSAVSLLLLLSLLLR